MVWKSYKKVKYKTGGFEKEWSNIDTGARLTLQGSRAGRKMEYDLDLDYPLEGKGGKSVFHHVYNKSAEARADARKLRKKY